MSRFFPDGALKARVQFEKTLQTLRDHPLAGRQGEESTREILVGRTPFMFVYVVRNDRVEIIRVWDQRAGRSEDWP
ncbi:type II toxin-antitoxin system RelE/ParE family toxin [Jiella pacifica]|uniref:Type II toxin-antitoxin system RelE/ParE family toxin n=1 Tax=Jiella pacifica TaxID=2696469 RepID=A0A6N9T262_9HYPH|nr:type II toxin-antitoxin system RelE/ParE family toxin [Jiella pacifica]NDW03969.1 type II toxin-antitoxin system RelE/ParE family toxin [Jiella pacifica]